MPTSFESLEISEPILRSLLEEGYSEPTPIQELSIPPSLEGRDVIGCAQTGTGKTAAFGIPILQRLTTETYAHEPRALVLTPTRELAQQVADFIARYGRHLKLRSAVIVGGVSMGPQVHALRTGCDVVIATPGRLIDLKGQGHLQLSRIEIAVLDEADRMLDMGFIPDVRRIFRMLPRQRQTLFFSATMGPEIEYLARDFLREPVRVEVAPPATPVDKVRQIFHPVDFPYKEQMLDYILRSEKMEQVLIFTKTKRAADFVTEYLQSKGHDVLVIHGDLHQKKRTRALEDFRSARTQIMVATDVASRGLDVEGISHVINFDMPDAIDDYIHRIGRTARADTEGVALSLVELKDLDMVRQVEKRTGREIARVLIPGFEPKTAWYMSGGSTGSVAPSNVRQVRSFRPRSFSRRRR